MMIVSKCSTRWFNDVQFMVTYLKVVLGGLKGSVGDLAVVDNNGITLGAALLVSPADALRELGLRVGKEQLQSQSAKKNPVEILRSN
jgi:hypothetical protein